MTEVSPQTGDDYFTSYCDLSVHELMLQDRPRTTFYRKFFETHRDFVKGKIVMDVGAGTGILSLFAATAGAKTVYAVEASHIASLCEEIVQDNEFESVIKVIHGAVEDIKLPGDVKVDIIVSEWMGFYLLHESMLDSVLTARDKFLAPGGVIVPSKASLHMAPVDMSSHFRERADYWSNIYGYDFSPVASMMNIQEVSKPSIKILHPSAVKSEAITLLDFDLGRDSVEVVKSFSKNCKFPMSEESVINGFVTWFDVSFDDCISTSAAATTIKVDEEQFSKSPRSSNNDGEFSHDSVDSTGDAKGSKQENNNCDLNSICDKDGGDKNSLDKEKFPSSLKKSKLCVSSPSHTLSTSPFSPPTHWKQTVIFLPQAIMVCEDVILCCRVEMGQDSSNKRHYNIGIELKDENDLEMDAAGVEEDEFPSEGESGADSDDSCDHPVPCDCGSNRCRLISALVEKYDTEHQELGDEAEMVETEAEVEAAKEIDTAIEREGWSLDTSGTDGTENKHNSSKGDD